MEHNSLLPVSEQTAVFSFPTYFSKTSHSHSEPSFAALYQSQSPCCVPLFRSAFVYWREKGEFRGSGYYVLTVLHVECLPSLCIPSSARIYNEGWTRQAVGERKRRETTENSTNVHE
jgi:hypothetical protein